MLINSDIIKNKAKSIGSTLCGITSVESFSSIPSMSHPSYILNNARSVIVIAIKFLESVIESSSTIPYTIIRNYLSRRIDEMTIDMSYFLEENGYNAVPTGAIEPCNYNDELGKYFGLISLKNAAYQAGLGVIGKNTLLITPYFGNMVWLGAIITSAILSPDIPLTDNPCSNRCTICIDNCPAGALDGSLFIDQMKCWNHAFGKEAGGEWRIKCHKCRTICPYAKGYS